MTQDMLSDSWDWRSCAQVIVATDGTLLNGQKTCMALSAAVFRSRSFSFEGVEPDAWLVMDNVQPRTLGQELRRDGVPNATQCAAVARGLWQYDNGIAITDREGPSQAVQRQVWV